MTARRGQVALYLIAALVAICILAMMNVSIYLFVSAKNKAMNAGDAASLAVAKYQGELLNRIGDLNRRHLRLLVGKEDANGDLLQECTDIVLEQKRICFLGPLEGIGIGSQAARNNGVEREPTGKMRKILDEHLLDIGSYANNPDMYPEPWSGAWQEYAQNLQVQLNGDVLAGPENPEFADSWRSNPLVNQAFYNAIAGRQWCWFKFHGMWIFDCDSSGMPRPDFSSPTPHWNSEIYPLHLTFNPIEWGTEEDREEWVKILSGIAECDEIDIRTNRYVFSAEQEWAFYDGVWSKWSVSDSEWIAGFNSMDFPIVGDVKPEYDVRGCAAKCRVITEAADLMRTAEASQTVVFTSASKPFGTVENVNGGIDVVTANRKFVTSAFTDVRLVPTDSVGGADLDGGADYDWITHVRKHLPLYFSNGPSALNGCWYCQQLLHWENPVFRAQGVNWLKYHSDECVISGGGGSYHGGSAHAH